MRLQKRGLPGAERASNVRGGRSSGRRAGEGWSAGAGRARYSPVRVDGRQIAHGRQFRWYRELFRPVGMKGFFYLLKSEACKAGINFQISKLIRKFIMTYLRSKSTENPKDLRYIRALRYIPAFSAVYPIFISTVKQRQKPHHHKTYGR